jgi:hypothetical protein
MRYRPGRRATIRYDLWLRDGASGEVRARTLYGKVYHDASKAASVVREMEMLSEAARMPELRLTVARPAGFLHDVPMVLQEPLAGLPLDLFLGRPDQRQGGPDPRVWDGMARAATAVAGLHRSGLISDRYRPVGPDLARMVKRSEAARALDPAAGGAMATLAVRLSGWLDSLPTWGAEETLLHGDCKPSQFLIDGSGVGILDFDHCGMGDPAADVGFFLASLRQRSSGTLESQRARQAVRPAWDEGLLALEQSFLDRYCETADRDQGFGHRAAWYQALALLRKAQRAFARSTRSLVPTALVEEAHRCLATLPEPSDR